MENPPMFGGEPGTPVPTVDPEDLKTVWRFYREVEKSHPGQRIGVCIDAIAKELKDETKVQAIVYRKMMLSLVQLVAPDVLAPCTKDGELNELAISVAAEFPMEWIGNREREGFPFDIDEFFRRVSDAQ